MKRERAIVILIVVMTACLFAVSACGSNTGSLNPTLGSTKATQETETTEQKESETTKEASNEQDSDGDNDNANSGGNSNGSNGNQSSHHSSNHSSTKATTQAKTKDIGMAKAKAIALSMVPGATNADIVEIEREYDDGRIEYEGEIRYDGYEYEFEIDGSTGTVLTWEIDD